MTEKPLHVLVAEALGCKPVQSTDPEARRRQEATVDQWGACWCSNGGLDKGPHSKPGVPTTEVARYDTDWSATGPLIERFEIDVWMAWPGDFGGDGFRWMACRGEDARFQCGPYPSGEGATPLLAVCELILALSAAGKLQPHQPEEKP